MDHDIDELIVHMRITQLKSRYCRFIDYKDWTALRGLLCDQATFVFPDAVVEGADAFVKRLVDLNSAADVHTVHHLHSPDIMVTGEGTAKAYWPLFDYSDKFWHDRQVRESHSAYSYYYEEYERSDAGEWLISRWELHRLRVDPHPDSLFPRPVRPKAIHGE